jgi:hypothetical protein
VQVNKFALLHMTPAPQALSSGADTWCSFNNLLTAAAAAAADADADADADAAAALS